MAHEMDTQRHEALKPIFKPWEEPAKHRVPGGDEHSPAIVEPGRRPSRCPLVRAIRAEVDLWRKGGYAGVSETSRYLLNHWFRSDHTITDSTTGESYPFRYHWAQREAIESIIFLHEMRKVKNTASLLLEFGDHVFDDIALGINPQEDQWLRCCCKIATGGGKTKVMSLAIVWSYFNCIREQNSDLVKHFVVIAPNLTVYERLKDDFENIKIFMTDPLIPEEWKGDFQLKTLLQDEPGGEVSSGAIYLTNIHRLYETRNHEDDEEDSIWGPEVKRGKALDTSIALRERIASHKGIMILNDEAHHLHDPELAWNKAIDSLHTMNINKGFLGVNLQLDFTATPKHNDGQFFKHIICDFPLGEAVDAGIVKVPVLGVSDLLKDNKDTSLPSYERYRYHLQIGYQRYEESYKQWKDVRKPILFVMTENSKAANEIANYLDSDLFPLLKGRVLNIHTNLKGRVRNVTRFGKKIKEFVESETRMKPEDLKKLREMSRDLDSPDSKFRCIVSVLMLREGWDIKNVTTIVPLRPYSAKSGILPEQTLGRGLRRMIPFNEVPEMVTVIHHPAFKKLYDEELQLEGFNISVLQERESLKQSVTIYVDSEKKDVEELEISIPFVSDSIETSSKLEGLTLEEVAEEFKKYEKLPIGKEKKLKHHLKVKVLFTNELVEEMKLDLGLLTNSWSATQYYTKMLARACKLTEYNNVLLPLVQDFISKLLFEREVDLFSGEIDHRMQDADVKEHILAVFTPLIMDKMQNVKVRKRSSVEKRISEWKPYQATSTKMRPAVPAGRTMFNLVPCDSSFEEEFAAECDILEDVAAFAKNAGPQRLTIDYLKPDKHRAMYVPDFFVRVKSGDIYLCELKGREDPLVPLKAKAAIQWCKSASKGKVKWHYLYVPYHLFQQSTASSIQELARACEPSLINLIKEGDSEQIYIDFDTVSEKDLAEPLFDKLMQGSSIASIPENAKNTVRQSLLILDHAEKISMNEFAHAFQPLLMPLDEYATKLLANGLKDSIPENVGWREAYFSPDLSNLYDKRKERALEKFGRYLQNNLIFGRPIMRLGTLLFCLDYAQQEGWGAEGVWKDVEQAYSGEKMKVLYDVLSEVNEFRNTRVAHVEIKLTDAKEAWSNMRKWVLCLSLMDENVKA